MSTEATRIDTGKISRGMAHAVSRLERLGPDLAKHYPGPLVLLDRLGHAEPLNTQAAALATALNESLQPQVIALLARASESGSAQSDFVRIGEARAGLVIELTIIPLAASGDHLVLGRDATLDNNLREALIESRKRFKDLVECSSDFVWETDNEGRFTFVTSRGALGHEPDGLIGRTARSLLDRRRPAPSLLPFEAKEPTSNVEVWLRDAKGEPVCLLVSGIPLSNADGTMIGARGVCRDVTETRKRDAALAKARSREAMFASIVKTIRDEVEPGELLFGAARALAEGLGVAACWIWRAGADDQLYISAEYGETNIGPAKDDMSPVHEGVVEMELGNADQFAFLLACPIRYRGRRNGVICIARHDRRRPESDEAKILTGVADQLGIALQQIETQEKLLALSRTDELTGLCNRRAFVDGLRERTSALRKSGQSAGVLYVDLDNFKPVNDVHGHQQGDLALRELADLLRECFGDQGILARLGGDEFAVWLEPLGAEEAYDKASVLVERAKALARFSEGIDPPLSVSVGVALFDPASGESIDGLLERADQAMYEAKKNGKGHYTLAQPA